MEISKANKAAETWNRIRNLKLRTLDLNSSTLIEVKNYKTPSVDVHQILVAALLLLGENEEKTQVICVYHLIHFDWNS